MPESKKQLIRQKLNDKRQALFDLLSGLDERQWSTAVFSEEGEGWRVADVVRHLMAAERGMTVLMEQIRQGGEGVPADFELNRYNAAMVRKAKEKQPDDLLAEMAENRIKLLALLDILEEDDWVKKGRHASMRIMSIEEIFNLVADHEGWHHDDIRRALN